MPGLTFRVESLLTQRYGASHKCGSLLAGGIRFDDPAILLAALRLVDCVNRTGSTVSVARTSRCAVDVAGQ